MRPNVRILLLVASVLAVSTLVAGTAAARVYKWVDEKGQVHVESTPPPIDYEWADRAGFYYNRDKVPGKELNHLRPRPAAADGAPGKPGAPRPGASSAPGEAAYRRVEGLVAQAERQALAFDEAEGRRTSAPASPLDNAWTTWQRSFSTQIDQAEQSLRADAEAPSSLRYALQSLRGLVSGAGQPPSRSSRESVIRSAQSSLGGARAELDRRAAARAAPSPPPALPAYLDEPRPVIVAPPIAIPSLAGVQGVDTTQILAAARTASLRQAMVQVAVLGGCEGGHRRRELHPRHLGAPRRRRAERAAARADRGGPQDDAPRRDGARAGEVRVRRADRAVADRRDPRRRQGAGRGLRRGPEDSDPEGVLPLW
ncbi:MAG: DUF4124 domain-containing protein [Deltaproteobacteria bacterium]|nr:DUF4124 domain-containing protein [Deltaproteobacteria bacterium]